ncbi:MULTISPECIES: hypothetical protein [unclassified Legionella]|uniref:hypothetical protein n=1 Tax=unclassified Legionella TaxID=2622702 RepID=UPI001055EB05|nr:MULTISPECIES: hypothetical protein [unclassified Legionella]MDI9819427.1 hypothetical protein [Legionella sp. PL877]
MKNNYPEAIMYYGQPINSKISLKYEFKNERKAMRFLKENGLENKYIDKEKQKEYVINLYEDEGDIFFSDSKNEWLDGEYLFVLTCEENPKLLCDKTMHHSFMANGKKVLAAGSLLFENGVLQEVTNDSGHYRPTDEEMLPVIKALYSASNGTLRSYKSYCSDKPLIFPVIELIDIIQFSSVKPLQISEIICTQTGARILLSDYDHQDDDSSSEQRFGKKLPQEVSTQYKNLIENSPVLFRSKNTATLWIEEDTGLLCKESSL